MSPPHRLLLIVLVAGLLGGAGVAQGQVKMPPQSLGDALQKASAEGNPVLLEVYAPWCPYCQRMQKNVYADSTVRAYLSSHFTYARLNSDTDGGQHQFNGRTLSTSELASALGARGVPTTVFLKPDGTLIARQPGYIKRPMFLKMIRYIGSGAYREQSFQAYTGRSK